ncbi:MAG TPA: polysaccharide pyruvyl transferase family protein [Polyangiaceae bacterium]|nr:polysaccharide pyruvyl transferase family protein [Polyangiaceae bacterium]
MKHILIVNQHGENRGDEAAMNAMLSRFEQELGNVRFTLLYQFRDKSLRLKFKQQVTDLPIVLPPGDYLRAAFFSLADLSKLDLRMILTPTMRQIIEAYESADMVVSAPGGPYFGDIYANHELVHWWYIWLGHRFGKPLFLYAPSAGPFQNALLNPIRRRMYRLFDVLVTREEISQRNLHRLLGKDTLVHVTADSAIQSSVPAASRSDHFAGERAHLASKFLVAVSLNDYKYPGETRPNELREQYNRAMLTLLHHLHGRRDCHFLLLPQLHGKVHSDVPFLQAMAQRLDKGVSWELIDPAFDSDQQRALFAMCDFHVASRYHPAIFGHTGLTPGICIYYEHKALGFMAQLGLERYAFDIRRPDASALCRAADDILQNHGNIVQHLEQRVPELRQRARRSTELAVELLRRHDRASTAQPRQKAGGDALEAKAAGPLG